LEECPFLECPRLVVAALGQIEDDSMSMELWRSVSVHRAGRVMLKFGGDELARGLSEMIAADPRLRVVLQFP
jgi:hypothetical protein